MLKIVITGGPCGGKSSIMSFLTQALESRGYTVFVVPETATELILNGIRPCENISLEDFQRFILDKQLSKEAIYNKVTEFYNTDKVIVLYDRGLADMCAYINKETIFKQLLKERGLTLSDAYSRYDAVLHLVTAANGAEDYYQWNDPAKNDCGNNAARSENPEEAREKDNETLNAWVGHPHLRVFDNSTDFNGKKQRVINEIFALLGEPVPKEIERKFLIVKPSREELRNMKYISKTEILQTYLNSKNPNVERRVRQRGSKKEGYTYYYTEKATAGFGERIEREEKISPAEYAAYLSDANTELHQISKMRYCFVYKNQYFEMDIYPFSDAYAILEIELNDINDDIEFPPLNIVKDVTGNGIYRNSFLAKTRYIQS